MHKKGISLNSVENFLSHRVDKIRRRTYLCFARTLVSSKGGGKLHGFVKKFFISEDRKNFAWEPLCVSEKFGLGKNFMDKGGGGITISRRKVFVSYIPKYFIGEHFGFSGKFFIEKFHA